MEPPFPEYSLFLLTPEYDHTINIIHRAYVMTVMAGTRQDYAIRNSISNT